VDELRPREASRIVAELGEAMAGQDTLDRFERRLGDCARLPLWANHLDRFRNALEDRMFDLLSPIITKEKPTMTMIPPGNVRPVFVHDYDGLAEWTPAQEKAIGRVLDSFDRLPETLASQLVVDVLQLLPAERQREIAGLIGAV